MRIFCLHYKLQYNTCSLYKQGSSMKRGIQLVEGALRIYLPHNTFFTLAKNKSEEK